jgi:uncharacterized surface protein with fasciclin (FAS1) repeats
MKSPKRLCSIGLLAALVAAAPSTSFAETRSSSPNHSATILEILTETDGAQAVVAAALVVDEAGVLDFSLAELLADKRSEVILLAPSNAAFENLLGLEPGTLDGLTIEQAKDALPGLLPTGVGPDEVAAILLKHAALPKRASKSTASAEALLRQGVIHVADGSQYPVGVGGAGVAINYETTIIKPDSFAKNGVVHFIDTVIIDGLL